MAEATASSPERGFIPGISPKKRDERIGRQLVRIARRMEERVAPGSHKLADQTDDGLTTSRSIDYVNVRISGGTALQDTTVRTRKFGDKQVTEGLKATTIVIDPRNRPKGSLDVSVRHEDGTGRTTESWGVKYTPGGDHIQGDDPLNVYSDQDAFLTGDERQVVLDRLPDALMVVYDGIARQQAIVPQPAQIP